MIMNACESIEKIRVVPIHKQKNSPTFVGLSKLTIQQSLERDLEETKNMFTVKTVN